MMRLVKGSKLNFTTDLAIFELEGSRKNLVELQLVTSCTYNRLLRLPYLRYSVIADSGVKSMLTES